MTDLATAMDAAGIDLVATLPDSWLSGAIEHATRSAEIDLVRVAREDDGVGVCAGAWLGGRRALLLCQNAGLLLAANALAAFAHHHQVPVVAVAADRGGPGDAFYYQQYKGQVTTRVLDALGITWHRVTRPEEFEMLPAVYQQAVLQRRPVAVLADKAALRVARAEGCR